MMKGGVLWSIMLALLVFQQHATAQQDPEKLFLSIKELSGSNPERAEEKMAEYIRIGAETKSDKIVANAYYLLGRINYFKSRNYISNEYYKLAIRSAYAKKDLSFAESCLNNIGINYEMQLLTPQALAAYQKSLKYAEQLKDSVSMGQSWINIGLLNAKIGKFGRAREMTQRALAFFSSKNDILNIALCHQNLGYILTEEKNNAAAIQQYFKCLFLNRKVGNQFEVLNLTFNLGSNYSELDLFYHAEQYLRESLNLALTQDRRDVIAKVYIQQAENDIKRDWFGKAELKLAKARKLIDDNQLYELEHLLFDQLSKLYAKSGNFAAYQRVVAEIGESKKNFSVMETLARTDEVQALNDFQKNLRQIKMQAKKIEERRSQMYLLSGLSIFLAAVLTILTIQHLKARKYMRSLFKSKVQRALYDFPGNETVVVNKHYLQEVYPKVVEFTQKAAKREIDLATISKSLEIREEYIAQSIRLFGKNEQKHFFFQTFFVNELCKQMISEGKKTSLKHAASNSPFATSSDLSKHFREVTGLKPGQFMRYCEARLKEKQNP